MVFIKGQSGNPNGRPKIDPEVKTARQLTQNQFSLLVNKYLNMDRSLLKEAVNDPKAPMLELIVAKIVEQAISKGDQVRLNFILDRLIGKVPDQLTTHNVHLIEQAKEIASLPREELLRLAQEEIKKLE